MAVLVVKLITNYHRFYNRAAQIMEGGRERSAQSSWIYLVSEGSEHPWLAQLRCRAAVVRQAGETRAQSGEGGHRKDRNHETGVLV